MAPGVRSQIDQVHVHERATAKMQEKAVGHDGIQTRAPDIGMSQTAQVRGEFPSDSRRHGKLRLLVDEEWVVQTNLVEERDIETRIDPVHGFGAKQFVGQGTHLVIPLRAALFLMGAIRHLE